MTAEDIRLFVTDEMERHPKLRRLKPATKVEVIATLSVGADGVFRRAGCWLEQIARSRNERDVKKVLRCLPVVVTEDSGEEARNEIAIELPAN